MQRKPTLYFRSALWLLILFAGCDGSPRLPVRDIEVPMPENVVAEYGRDGADWFYEKGKFDVVAPSELPLFEKLDREQLVAKFPTEPFVERSEPYRPIGMDDDVYVTFSRLTEPFFDTDPFLEIPFLTDTSGMFAISADGERLALATPERLEIWDLKLGQSVSQHALPARGCRGIAWSSIPGELLVMAQAAIYCVSAQAGEILHEWEAPASDGPASFACALSSPVTVVATNKGRMFALDRTLKATHEHVGPVVSTGTIAIRPDANWVLAQSDSGLIRWHLDTSPTGRIEEVGPQQNNRSQASTLIAGHTADIAVEPHLFINIDADAQPPAPRRDHCNFSIHATSFASVDVHSEWLLNCFSRPDKSGGREYFLQDLHLNTKRFSLEFPIEGEAPLELRSSLDSEVCAVRDVQGVRVYRRQPWKDVLGVATLERLTQLAIDGRFDQLELAAAELRKIQRTRVDFGEIHFASLASKIGARWASQEILSINGETSDAKKLEPQELAKIQKSIRDLDTWRATGSELAVLSSSFRYFEKALLLYDKRRDEAGNTVGDRASLDEQLALARAEMKPLLLVDQPSCGALRVCSYVASYRRPGEPEDEKEMLREKLMEICPYDARLHVVVCTAMKSQFRMFPGMPGSFANSAADLIPEPYGSSIYARTAVGLKLNFGVFANEYGGFSRSKVVSAMKKMIDRKDLKIGDAESAMQHAVRLNYTDWATMVAKYHVQSFPVSQLPEGEELALLKSVHEKMYSE